MRRHQDNFDHDFNACQLLYCDYTKANLSCKHLLLFILIWRSLNKPAQWWCSINTQTCSTTAKIWRQQNHFWQYLLDSFQKKRINKKRHSSAMMMKEHDVSLRGNTSIPVRRKTRSDRASGKYTTKRQLSLLGFGDRDQQQPKPERPAVWLVTAQEINNWHTYIRRSKDWRNENLIVNHSKP